MAGTWTGFEIKQSFSDPIHTRIATLRADLIKARTPPINVPWVNHIGNELQKNVAFNQECTNISSQIINGNLTPIQLNLKKATEANGTVILNFYEFAGYDWRAYFHIDYKF